MRGVALIVTLEADETSQSRSEAARRRWFPPRRNHVPAPLTLFHQLPGASEEEALLRLHRAAAAHAPLGFRVTGPRSLGRGVTYALDLPGGEALRDEIGLGIDRTPQDSRKLDANVTVQNKVSRDEAAATLQALRAGFAPWEGEMVALRLWRYLGGRWGAAGRIALR